MSATIQTPSRTAPDILDAQHPFQTRMELRWGDMDGLHHVNNTVYFRYFEEARIRLFRQAGLNRSDGTGCVTVLAHAACDFLKPLMYPAHIVVGLKLVRVGRSSIEFECWIADADDPARVHARGRNVVVCIDGTTGRAKAWTDADRTALVQCFSA